MRVSKASGSQNHQQALLETNTLVLLTLWDLGARDVPIKRGELIKRIIKRKQKSSDLQLLLDSLEKEDYINSKDVGKRFQLTDQGFQALRQLMLDPHMSFSGTQIRAKIANCLLKWIRQLPKKDHDQPQAIQDFEMFKKAALVIYDQLNRDYNYDDLVPIYRIRREIGDRVSRRQFNEWLIEMQAQDTVQLQGGSVEDSALDKIEDSITTEISGLRCYVKRLS